MDRQKRSNRWRVVVTTRYEEGIQGFEGSEANEATGIGRSICIHDISDLSLAFSRPSLKRTALNSPPRFSLFSLPFLSQEKITFRLRSGRPYRVASASLCFPLYRFVTSLSLSLLYLFCPLVFSPSSHTFILCRLYGLRLYIPVCTLRRKRKEKKRDGKSCHSSTANPSFLSFSRKSSLPWIFSRESQFPGERDWIKLEPKGWKDCLLESVVKFVGLGRSRDVTCYSLAGGNLSW